jgi:serine kinase of HPr protein (carbohydrate metabolism regulator)
MTYSSVGHDCYITSHVVSFFTSRSSTFFSSCLSTRRSKAFYSLVSGDISDIIFTKYEGDDIIKGVQEQGTCQCM